jgi:hypothetical protein
MRLCLEPTPKPWAVPPASCELRRGEICPRGVSPQIDTNLFAGKEGQECCPPQLIVTYPTQPQLASNLERPIPRTCPPLGALGFHGAP